MNDIESPIDSFAIAPEDIEEPEVPQTEIMPGFEPMACMFCKINKLQLVGSMQENLILVCQTCGQLNFIRFKQQSSQVKIEPRVPMGVG
jgi:hypothetical protein